MNTHHKGTGGKPFALPFMWNLVGSPLSIHPWGQLLHFHGKASITTTLLQRLSPNTVVKGLYSDRVNWKPGNTGERNQVTEPDGTSATSIFCHELTKKNEYESIF